MKCSFILSAIILTSLASGQINIDDHSMPNEIDLLQEEISSETDVYGGNQWTEPSSIYETRNRPMNWIAILDTSITKLINNFRVIIRRNSEIFNVLKTILRKLFYNFKYIFLSN